MSVEPEAGNATAPTPAIAPGAEGIELRSIAGRIARDGTDPRVRAAVPGFDAPFFQAGLAGYSDAAMRIIARRHGCPFCVTEALLDRTLLAGGRGFAKADLGELHDNIPGGPEDQPLACQIMGSDPREMAASALKAVEQSARGDKPYRALAYATPGRHPTTHARQHLRLPGGEQIEPFDPTEGLGDEGCGVDGCEADGGEGESCEDAIDRINALDGAGDGSIGGDEAFGADGADGADPAGLEPPGAGVAAGGRAFATIDVNLACPVKKIKVKARGGHWLAEPEGAIAIMRAVRDAVPASVPCTVKLRRSFDDTPGMARNASRILDAAADLGYAWATVHARTVVQKYVGPSRWDLLREIVRRHPRLPILGSGDVWNAWDIVRMIGYTGVSAAAVARGCIGNPWIFRQAREILAGRDPRPPTIAEQRSVLLEHFSILLAVNRGMRHGEEATSKMMRKFGIRFAAHHPRVDDVRRRFIQVRSRDEWLAVVRDEYAG
ncbi:MAG: tRNA-dihydrouridine synthase family protein [Phycisphaeraceae bacterium]|nr:MAG: tRNA-dihydrouridine synthase family protein [Phycisphaeraceae bacterium]